MENCSHTQWLRVWRRGGRALLEASDAPTRLLDAVPNCDAPANLVLCVGNETKSRFLNSLDSRHITQKASCSHGEVHLQAASLNKAGQFIIAHGDLPAHSQLPHSPKTVACHEISLVTIGKSFETAYEYSDYIYCGAVLPLTSILCIFVDDIGGITPTLRLLVAWITQYSAAFDGPCKKDIVLIVQRSSVTKLQREIDVLVKHGPLRAVPALQSHICIISEPRVRTRSGKQASQLRKLCSTLSNLLASQLTRRKEAGLAFSARHLTNLLGSSVDSLTAVSLETFSPLKTSRTHNPPSPDLDQHIFAFLKLFPSVKTMQEAAFPLVATSLIHDHYAPDMHQFNISDVFSVLYLQPCRTALEKWITHCDGSEHALQANADDLLVDIHTCLIDKFEQLKQFNGSQALQKSQLAAVNAIFPLPSLTQTCLSCVARRPQHPLPCGHWICSTCVLVFGKAVETDYFLFTLDSCVVCGKDTNKRRIRIVPFTASVRSMCVEGGGAKGRGPLEMLKELQRRVNLPYLVQRNFDFIFGTSSGAMIASALALNGWDVEDCIESFERSSSMAFKRRPVVSYTDALLSAIPTVASTLEFAIALISGCKYPADGLEAVLQDTYGVDERIVDSKFSSETGIHVGVTLTGTNNTNTYIVTSYNGSDGVSPLDYRHLHISQDVPLWEILRCCTAAPYYFLPHRIEGQGSYQDGGLIKFNNPSPILLKEVRRQFPTAQATIFVSLGTGYEPDKVSSGWIDMLGGWFPFRVFRAFTKQGDSTDAWNQMLDSEPATNKRDFYRFDVRYENGEPGLDDVNSMAYIAETAHQNAVSSGEMALLARKIRSELFVFELDINFPPKYSSGVYHCYGFVTCRLGAGTPELHEFLWQLKTSSAALYAMDSVLLDFSSLNLDTAGSALFRRRVLVKVYSRQQDFDITLREPAASGISSSPFTLERLCSQQKLYACFGTADHRKRCSTEDLPRPKKMQKRVKGLV